MDTPSSAPFPFLHATGPWESAKVWRCSDCPEGGDLQWMDDMAPREHVMLTGHEVRLIKTAEMWIMPVSTQPPG